MELSDCFYSVGQLTRLIKELFWRTEVLREVAVRGELSSCKRHTSGHLYFTLKDDTSALKGVMFRQDARTLRFQPKSGMQVVAYGRVGVYERDGVYQLYVQRMEPDGLGSLHLALEQLKSALAKEGWFDPARKRPLPRLPRAVGVVTALGSAALSDIIKVAQRRYPTVHLVIAGVTVQGLDAPPSIVRGLEVIASVSDVDVIIMGRGGGAREELWAFNDGDVVRAVGNSPIPVVTAIGHQTDVTLADLAADVRAATPSHAAELAVPLHADLELALTEQVLRLRRAMQRRLEVSEQRWHHLVDRSVFRRPLEIMHQQRQRHDDLQQGLQQNMARRVQTHTDQVGALVGRLDALNPLAVLARGFSVCRDETGRVLKSVQQVSDRATVSVQLNDGRLHCRVEERMLENRDVPVLRGEGHDERQ